MIDALIESVDVSAYTVPTDAPEADGTITWASTTVVVVQVRAGRTVGTGWTYAPAAGAVLVRDVLAPLVRGRDALDIGALSNAMVQAVRNFGRPGMASYAISAVDLALWDLKARLVDLPLHRLLGAVRAQVPIMAAAVYGIRRRSAAAAADRLDGPGHRTGQDQDRRVVGGPTPAATWTG